MVVLIAGTVVHTHIHRMSRLSPLYRSYAKLVQEFDAAKIPVVRLCAAEPVTRQLDVFASLEAAVSSGDRAALPEPARLTQQLRVLLGAEEHTRQAMSTWHGLISRYRGDELTPSVVCAAVEDTAIASADVLPGEPAWPLTEDLLDAPASEQDGQQDDEASVRRQLDDLARDVRESGPGTLSQPGRGHALPGMAHEHLTHINQVLVREMKFHQKPFEWAYEGLAPLLLRDVLHTRRGIGLSLTMLFAAVGSRLGLHLLPCPLSPRGGQQAEVVVGVPDVGRWVLMLRGCREEENLYWDPLQGIIMDAPAYAKAHPGVVGHQMGEKHILLRVWTELLETAMVAHQRRGDSDAIGHCIHQLLAVDLAYPAWPLFLYS